MSDRIYIGREYADFRASDPHLPVSKVRLIYDDERAYEAGDDTGSVIEAECPWATQAMATAILAQLQGYVYRPYEAEAASIPPETELGDTAVVGSTSSEIASIKTDLDALSVADISAPAEEDVEKEYQYLDRTTRELRRRVTLGRSYYGTRIDRTHGLQIVKTTAEGQEQNRVTLNSDVLEFLDNTGQRALYFDATTGEYVFRGYIRVQDGHLIFEGTSQAIQVRYSTDKTATVPSGWSTTWSDAWSNTSMEVWAIYSYNAGQSWTDPLLVQGKDGATGPQGPQGPAASVPDWVRAYTSSAQYDTLVTDEWVVAMNLYGSKIFAGSTDDEYALMTSNGFKVFDAQGNQKICLGLESGSSYDTPFIQLGAGGTYPAGLVEKFGRGIWIGTATAMGANAEPSSGTGIWIDFGNDTVYKVINGAKTEIASSSGAEVTAVWG